MSLFSGKDPKWRAENPNDDKQGDLLTSEGERVKNHATSFTMIRL